MCGRQERVGNRFFGAMGTRPDAPGRDIAASERDRRDSDPNLVSRGHASAVGRARSPPTERWSHHPDAGMAGGPRRPLMRSMIAWNTERGSAASAIWGNRTEAEKADRN